MKVLVTGAAGFIGANFIGHCRSVTPDWDIVGLDDLSTGDASNLDGLETEFIQASVVDTDALAAAAEDADAIVHLAALGSVPRSVKNPVQSHNANLTGTLNVLEAARRTGAYVVFASSSSVYGANLKLPKTESDWTRPMSPYAVTKLGAEAYVLAYQHSYDLPSMAFRFFNVYGPLQAADHAYAAVIPRFLKAAFDGTPLSVHGDGMQTRDFTFVDTVTAVLHSAVENRIVDPSPVNLAYGTNTTLLTLIEMIKSTTGFELDIEHVEPRRGDVRASQADGVRVREFFPNVPLTSLEHGLNATVDWFRSTSRANE